MSISAEFERVAQEFVPGDAFFEALRRQEGVNEHQLASWFLRNIEVLNALPMLKYSREVQNFQYISPPWASDFFHEVIQATPLSDRIDWDEDRNGYIGGWLSSDLESFCQKLSVAFPRELILEVEPTFIRYTTAKSIPRVTPASNLDAFLEAHNLDFIGIRNWADFLHKDRNKVGLALSLAFEKTGLFPPIFHIENPEDNFAPNRLPTAEASSIWAQFALSFIDGECPDEIFRLDETTVWASSLVVRQSDCNKFAVASGLPLIQFINSSKGECEKGKVDLDAESLRDQKRRAVLPPITLPPVGPARKEGREEGSPSTRERNTLLKMIIGMAIKGYGYDPSAGKNTATAEIANDLAALGIEVSDDTVRKHLKAATQAVLPQARNSV